jgi:hypothetical protein
MKNTFEEIGSNSLERWPIHDLLDAPVSLNIAEILEYLEDSDFEDWLTADLFENAGRMPLRHLCAHCANRSKIGSVDVFMVEIIRRTGKIWDGKFQVEFAEVQSGCSKAEPSTEQRSAELFFTLDTESAELVFLTNIDRENQRFASNIPHGSLASLEHEYSLRDELDPD